ncbi:hypothetical protein ACFYVL_18040 [Streptomyces sp. NPDC004111]|uniref:hypothetical protein n=1 Tax=Streptomyces sp. NPDC004111 TaxID=3364690 RepID=UPI0036B129BA
MAQKGKQRLEMDKKSDTGEETAKRRIDLSVPQVAGSALAAVVAAVLASQLGVYGTVIGAGVVSIVATSGGSIFQHLFKRTGEQLREVTVHARPKENRPYGDNGTRVLRQVEVPTDLAAGQLPGEGEFGEATVHGTRVRGWKRSALAAAVVFAVAMGGITTYELIAQKDVSGGKGTSIGNFVRGGEKKDPPAEQPPATTTPDGSGSGGGRSPDPGTGGQSPDTGTGKETGEGSGGDRTPGPGATTTPDPGKGDGATGGDGSGGGASGRPTPPAEETPAGGGGADGANGAGGDKDGAGAQSAPPRSGATAAP